MSQEQQSQIDDLIRRYYAAFDNRSNRAIGVDELRRIFMTDARVTRVVAGQVDSWTVEQFISPREAMLTDGTLLDFHEWEVEGVTDIFADIAQRRSRYRKSGKLRGQPYSGEGYKLIQLCRSQGQWRIISVLWEDVSAA